MAQWIAKFEGFARNGDVVVTTAKGRLVAVIYAINAQPEDAATMERAKAFIAAAEPTWCSTCGKDTLDRTDTCATCTVFWAEHAAAEALQVSA